MDVASRLCCSEIFILIQATVLIEIMFVYVMSSCFVVEHTFFSLWKVWKEVVMPTLFLKQIIIQNFKYLFTIFTSDT
jgi:hypothetical protein